MRCSFIAGAIILALAGRALAGTVDVVPVEITEWKAVYGRVEARDTVPARARIGGTVEELLARAATSEKVEESAPRDAFALTKQPEGK